MRFHFRYISILIIPLLFLVNETHSQKKKSTKNRTTSIKTNSSKHSLPIPHSVDPDQYQSIKDMRQDLLNYFVFETHSVQYFNFNKETEKVNLIHIDSLLPKFKEFVDAFIQSNKWKINEDTEYLINERTNKIYEEIKTESDKGLNKQNDGDLKKILDSIVKMPNSKEKVWLTLKYDDLKIQNETYVHDVDSFCRSAEKIADLISENYDRGKSYTAIGNFAANYHIDNIAIWSYYQAREDIQNSSKDLITKYNEQGKICKKLAHIFTLMNLSDAQLKASNYYREAIYDFGKSNNTLEKNVCSANIDAIAEYLNVDLPDPNIAKSKQQLETEELHRLEYLKDWYSSNPGKHNYGNETNYFNFYSIATFLRGENKKREALVYYYNALSNALNLPYPKELEESIYFISFTYSLLGEEKLAMGFSDLCIYLAEKIHDPFAYYREILEKSNYYLLLKKYDSALSYANKIQYYPNLFDALKPSLFNEILEKVSSLKYEIFDSLSKRSSIQGYRDSALTYYGYYLQNQNYHFDYYAKMLQVETDCLRSWEKRNRDYEIQSFNNEIKYLDIEKHELLFRTNELKSDTDKLGKLNRRYTDSLLLKQIAIKKIRNQLFDSSRKLERISASYSHLSQTNQHLIDVNSSLEKIKKALFWIVGILVIAAVLLIFITFNKAKTIKALDKKIVQKQEEAEKNDFGKKLAEQKLLNDTALGHDLLTQLDHIPAFIEALISSEIGSSEYKKLLNECLHYSEDVNEYFHSNFALKDKLQNKLADEIDIAIKYAQIWERMQEKSDFIKINTSHIESSLLEEIEIPKHNIVNFVSNSFRHGGKTKKQIVIDIKAYREKNCIILIIEDDGIGFASLDLNLKEENRGLNLVLKQIDNYNSIKSNKYKIIFSPLNILNKIDNGISHGVKVTYTICKK